MLETITNNPDWRRFKIASATLILSLAAFYMAVEIAFSFGLDKLIEL